MLIVNKDKQFQSEDKQASARLLRRMPLNDVRVPGKPKRHDQNVCPVCEAPIEKTARGVRRKHSCAHCGATRNKSILCESCGTSRVWQSKRGAACRGCGAKYKSPGKKKSQ
jgi:hypothetical protein